MYSFVFFTTVFNEEIIQRSISGLCSSGIFFSLKANPSTLAYKTKNWYVLYSVPKNFRCTSLIPSRSNFIFSQGDALVTRYQRVASAPKVSMVLNGSTTLPRRLLILLPFLSSTSPLETQVLYATLSNNMAAMA